MYAFRTISVFSRASIASFAFAANGSNEPKTIDAAGSPKDRFSEFSDWMSKLRSRPSHRPNLRFPKVVRDFILPRGWVIFQNHSQRVYRVIGTAD